MLWYQLVLVVVGQSRWWGNGSWISWTWFSAQMATGWYTNNAEGNFVPKPYKCSFWSLCCSWTVKEPCYYLIYIQSSQLPRNEAANLRIYLGFAALDSIVSRLLMHLLLLGTPLCVTKLHLDCIEHLTVSTKWPMSHIVVFFHAHPLQVINTFAVCNILVLLLWSLIIQLVHCNFLGKVRNYEKLHA